MPKILLGSTNPSKKERLAWLFSGLDIFELVSVEDAGINLDIDENGGDFEENAVIKARAYSSAFDGLAISSDGGVSIPALGSDWNDLLTHRFAGHSATNLDRLDALLEMMRLFRGEDRRVVWNEAVAVAYKGKLLISLLESGETGYLQERYDKDSLMPGFWLASIWLCPRFGKVYAKLTDEERENRDFTWPRVKERLVPLLKRLDLPRI